MGKTRNSVTSILCSVLLIASTITATAASPYAVVIPCTQCRVGNVTRTISVSNSGHNRIQCEHGLEGYDVYDVIDTIERVYCDNCSYGTTDFYREVLFAYCEAGLTKKK